jgi:DNA-binding transcriptional ArsR family regulator
MKEPILQMKADIFNALAHPLRLKILEKLRTGPCCVCKIIPYVGGEQSNVSHHLAVLRRANIVKSEKKGLEVWYEIIDPMIFNMIDTAESLLVKNLNNKRHVLEQIPANKEK